MKISDFLSPGSSHDRCQGERQRCASWSSSRQKPRPQTGLAADEVVREIAKREELGSTGVGNGVALPHARLPSLKAPFAVFARLRHGIDFDAIDGEQVDIVVLLLLPEAGDGAKGNALACVARALRDAEALRKIRGAPDRDALFCIIANAA